MTNRTKKFLKIGGVVGLLALVGVIAIVMAIVDRVNGPAIAHEPPGASTNSLIPCGDGTFALSQEDCTRAGEEARDESGGATGSDGSGNCHAVDLGTLENNPTFGVDSFAQVNYWSNGSAEYDVLVGPGTYSRPEGYGGRIWEWVGCTEAQATNGITASWPIRGDDGVNVGGWGDPAVLTKLDS